jgi:hypothetical protein
MSGLQGAFARRHHDAVMRLLHVRRVRPRCPHQLRRQRLPVVRRDGQLAGRSHPLEADKR